MNPLILAQEIIDVTWRLAILPERIQSSVRWGICMSLH